MSACSHDPDVTCHLCNIPTHPVSHTPGPWNVGRSDVTVDLPDGSQVRQIRASGLLRGVANARLIAAAPDLLASLREVLGWHVEGGHAVPRIYIERAEAAIAKTGSADEHASESPK